MRESGVAASIAAPTHRASYATDRAAASCILGSPTPTSGPARTLEERPCAANSHPRRASCRAPSIRASSVASAASRASRPASGCVWTSRLTSPTASLRTGVVTTKQNRASRAYALPDPPQPWAGRVAHRSVVRRAPAASRAAAYRRAPTLPVGWMRTAKAGIVNLAHAPATLEAAAAPLDSRRVRRDLPNEGGMQRPGSRTRSAPGD